MSDRDLMKDIVKSHKKLEHKSEGHMLRLFLMDGNEDTKTRKLSNMFVKPVIFSTNLEKTIPRPSVAMSKAKTINEPVSLGLTEKDK